MKYFEGKTKEECIEKACKELNCTEEDLMYTVENEKKGILGLGKSCSIAVLEIEDVVEFTEKYIQEICKAVGLEVSTKPIVKNGLIKILIETDHNPLLIGRNGETLRSLNELVKIAVNNKFHLKFKILLDISEYKNKKYIKVVSLAKRVAKKVLESHIDAKLDPMTPDERKKVHGALTNWKYIKTESAGDGKERSVVIKYDGPADYYPPKNKKKNFNRNRKPKNQKNVANNEPVVGENVAEEQNLETTAKE